MEHYKLSPQVVVAVAKTGLEINARKLTKCQ